MSIGRKAIILGAQAAGLVARLQARLTRKRSALAYWAQNVLKDLSIDPGQPLFEYFKDMASDQAAVIQLTPEAMHLFNAAVTEAPDARYGCIVTAVEPTSWGAAFRQLLHPYRAGTQLLFKALLTITSRKHGLYPYAPLTSSEHDSLQEALGFPVDDRTNDGIAPTLSQVHGTILHATRGDHLDVTGQFAGAGGEAYADWMNSGSHFDEQRFEAAWRAVARHISACVKASG
jgi:hypothetical protein